MSVREKRGRAMAKGTYATLSSRPPKLDSDPAKYYIVPFSQLNAQVDKWMHFEDPNSDDNILYSEGTKGPKELKGATLDKLIQKITSPTEFDSFLLFTFLVTYRSFTTKTVFLEKLIARYNTPPPLEMQKCASQQTNTEDLARRAKSRPSLTSIFSSDNLDLSLSRSPNKQNNNVLQMLSSSPLGTSGGSALSSSSSSSATTTTTTTASSSSSSESTPALDEQKLAKAWEPFSKYQNFEQFLNEFLFPMRLRVIQVLRKWIEGHLDDFTENRVFCAQLQRFIYEISETQMEFEAANLRLAFAKIKQKLHNEMREEIFLQNRNAAAASKGATSVPSSPAKQPAAEREKPSKKEGAEPPKSRLPIKQRILNGGTVPLIHWPATEIARQLTLIEFELFSKIKAKECLNQNWNNEKRRDKAPNIYRMIEQTNLIGNWAATEILICENLKDRIHAITKFIKVAYVAYQLGNFGLVYSVIGGLSTNPIHRLKKTWEAVPPTQLKTFEEMRALLNPDQSYKKLREEVVSASPPCIPYIGLYLTDLTFIEDGNPDYHKNGLINIAKRKMLSTIIQNLQIFQQTRYNLNEVPELRDLLLSLKPLDQEQLYKLSLQREPRVGGPSKTNWRQRSGDESPTISPGTSPTNAGKKDIPSAGPSPSSDDNNINNHNNANTTPSPSSVEKTPTLTRSSSVGSSRDPNNNNNNNSSSSSTSTKLNNRKSTDSIVVTVKSSTGGASPNKDKEISGSTRSRSSSSASAGSVGGGGTLKHSKVASWIPRLSSSTSTGDL